MKISRVKRICDFLVKNELVVFLGLLLVLLRIPSLFEPNWYGDEQIYLAIGVGLRKGLMLYSEIFDHKPPLIYLLAFVTNNVMWFKLALLGFNLAGFVAIVLIAKKLFVKNLPVIVTGLVYVILTNIPLFEGNIVNAELLMIVPASYGVLLLLQKKVKRSWFLLAGALFGVAFLFKVPIGADLVGLVLWYFWYREFKFKKIFKPVIDIELWLSVIGFFLPLLVTSIYYYAVGSFEPYLQAVAGFNVGYVSAWEGGEKSSLLESGLFQRLMVLLVSVLVIFALRKKLGKGGGLILLLTAFSLFGVTLPGRPYPHYWVQTIPYLSLAIGGLFVYEIKKAFAIFFLAMGLTSLSMWRYGFWHYKSIPYYENFIRFILKQKSNEEYKSYFGGHVLQNERVGEYIRLRTENKDRIFVWGTEPSIYVEADRAPVGKYTVAFHIKDFKAYEEIMNDLESYKPKFIVMMKYEDHFRELFKFVNANYVLDLTVDQAEIYRKVSW